MKKVFSIIVLAALLSISGVANAGFLMGYIVGSATSGSAQQDKSGIPVVSDVKGHDIILCMAAYKNLTRCEIGAYRSHDANTFTPAEYAGINGYKIIYQTGVQSIGGTVYLLMEVSK